MCVCVCVGGVVEGGSESMVVGVSVPNMERKNFFKVKFKDIRPVKGLPWHISPVHVCINEYYN